MIGPVPGDRRRRQAVGFSAAAALVLSLLAQNTLRQVGRGAIPHWVLVAYGAAALAFACACVLWLGMDRLDGIDAGSTAFPQGAVEWKLFGLAMSCGLLLRLARLATIPDGLNHDAAFNGLYGWRILQGAPYEPYTTAAWGRETLFSHLIAFLIPGFGMERSAIIGAATLCGIVTLPLFYAMARSLFGPRVAVVAATAFAFSGWHLILSRTGWRAIMTPLFECLVVAAAFQALRTRSRFAAVLAAVGVAGALNSYDAGRVVPLLLVVLVGLVAWDRGRAELRSYRSPLLLFAAVTLALSGPMLVYAWRHWDVWVERAAFLHGAEYSPLRNIRESLLLFSLRGNGNDFFIDTPLLEWLPASFLVLGLAFCLVRIRRLEQCFVLVGFGVSLLPGILSRPNGNRCIAAMPFVYVIVGLGFVAFEGVVRAALGSRWRWLTVTTLGLALAYCGVLTWREYLGDARRQIDGYYPETAVLGRYLRTLASATEVHIAAGNYPRYTLTYLGYPGSGPISFPGDQDDNLYFTWHVPPDSILRVRPDGRRPVAFIVGAEPQFREIYEALLRRYPLHEIRPLRHPDRPDGTIFASAILVSRSELLASPKGSETERAPLLPPVNMLQGEKGDRPGFFNGPRDLAVCNGGMVYVADEGNDRVQAFAADGTHRRSWGRTGAERGMFREPHAVACDASGDVYVLDSWNGRVQVFGADGAFRREMFPPERLFGPRGLAVAAGRVYVTDAGHAKIEVFETSGARIGAWGVPGTRPGQFSEPVGIAVSAAGHVLVVDSGNSRIQVLDARGTPIRSWPVPGWAGTDLKEAYLDLDENGLAYLSDPAVDVVRVFDSAGRLVRSLPAVAGARGIAVRRGDVLLTIQNRVVSVPR
jgi:NHL repeat